MILLKPRKITSQSVYGAIFCLATLKNKMMYGLAHHSGIMISFQQIIGWDLDSPIKICVTYLQAAFRIKLYKCGVWEFVLGSPKQNESRRS
jgi:hypothetical protein